MTDRYILISDLNDISEILNNNGYGGWCATILKAVDLLKKQEAVKPEVYFVGQDKYKFYRCPACKTAWYCKCNYCLGCGQAVKWE
jgi:hypothetical protein